MVKRKGTVSERLEPCPHYAPLAWSAWSFHVIYQAWDVVFHHQMKHREESWKYEVQRSIFDELWGVSSTVLNAWYYFSNKIILEGEIKDAKMSSFSSDFKTLININFLYIFFMNY